MPREAKAARGCRGETPFAGCLPFSLSRGGVTAAIQRRNKNRRTTLDDAIEQWFAGNFELCLDLCHAILATAPDTLAQVTLLRARALLRLNRADEALRILDEFGWPESGDAQCHLRPAMLGESPSATWRDIVVSDARPSCVNQRDLVYLFTRWHLLRRLNWRTESTCWSAGSEY